MGVSCSAFSSKEWSSDCGGVTFWLGDEVCNVPWISRSARPEGVRIRNGNGLETARDRDERGR